MHHLSFKSLILGFILTFSVGICFGQVQLNSFVFGNGAVNSQGGNLQVQGTIGQSLLGLNQNANIVAEGDFWARTVSNCDSVVTNLNDSGPGSLRDAIACSVTGDTITFAINGTIMLTSGQIDIDEGVVIDAGSNSVIIDAEGNSRLFQINTTDGVVFRNLILQRGSTTEFGGAVFGNAPFTAINCYFNNNQAENGAVLSLGGGDMNLINCNFAFNSANDQTGAVIFFNGNLNVVNTIFDQNSSGSISGALTLVDVPSANVINSTFYGNNANGDGGAINSFNSNLVIQNSLFNNNVGNQAPDIFFNTDNGSTISANHVLLGSVNGSGLSLGVNNVVALDPLFSAPNAFDFSLQPFSPAHGNADPSLLPVDTYDADNDGDTSEFINFDINGDSRGSTAGCNFDIGAVETAQGSLTVINANDSGVGSLRSHMECALSNPNINQISFAIPGEGPHTINLLSELPFINMPNLTIDGTSQPGFSFDSPTIILDGGGAIPSIFATIGDNTSLLGMGMRAVTDRCVFVGDAEFVTISGNTIFTNAGQDHIAIFGSDNCNIFNNRIGLNTDGTVSSLGRPVLWFDNSSNNRISQNIIAGNANSLLLGVTNGSGNNEVTENLIGTNADRSQSFGGAEGLFIANASNNLFFRNTIANNNRGIFIFDNSQNNSISENNFFCNQSIGIEIEQGSHADIAAPIISSATTKAISGTAQANSVIELYEQDNFACPDAACQGTFVGFTQADGNGDWSFIDSSFAENAVITALQINANNTSPFAICSVVTCDITAEAIGGQVNCNEPSLTLQGLSNDPAASFLWTDPNGSTSTEQNPPGVDLPGIYTLTTMDSTGCTATTTTSVTADFTEPDIFLLGAQLDCNNPTTVLSGGSNTTGATFQWTGPNGFVSDTLNPEISAPGDYILTVTAPNGCTSSGTLGVSQDNTTVPTAGFTADINGLNVVLNSTATQNPFFTDWDFGNGQTATGDSTGFTFLTGGMKTITQIVGNQCGSDTLAQTIELMNPQEAVGFCFPEKMEGPIGDTLRVPVKVTNFENIASFQFSIHTGDPAVATILGVSNFNLPDLNTDDFNTINDTTLSAAWFFGNGATVPDSTVIFTVDVLLTGTEAICTPIFIDDDPIFIEVGVLQQNTVVSTPYTIVPGEVCVLPLADISGRIFRETDEGLREVQVACTDQPVFVTGPDGFYNFMDLQTGRDYTISPTRNTNPLDGVTAIDLALIQRHILNLQFLDSPYKVISADVDHSNSVGAIDLANIQRLILGKSTTFPNDNDAWRFVDASHTFSNPNNPFVPAFPEERLVVNLTTDVNDVDFVGMKLGDVNLTALGRLTAEPLELLVSETQEDGFSIITFSAKAAQLISAYQFEIAFDESQMELLHVEGADLPGISTGNFALHRLKEGIIPTLWFDPAGNLEGYAVEAGQPLFKLYFQHTGTLQTLEERIGRIADLMPSIGYTPRGAEMPIELSYEVKAADEHTTDLRDKISLEMLRPNPFREETQLNFYLPEAVSVNFQIRDALGRLVKEIDQTFQAGTQQITIPGSDLRAAGWYTIQMRSGSFSATRRMIFQNR